MKDLLHWGRLRGWVTKQSGPVYQCVSAGSATHTLDTVIALDELADVFEGCRWAAVDGTAGDERHGWNG